jgi:hypothetical protein
MKAIFLWMVPAGGHISKKNYPGDLRYAEGGDSVLQHYATQLPDEFIKLD